ncbi:ABC transporter permease, partial [Klebsiella pneumoniae]|nr:ABC transporter permease [Klebsiella pneumoniae]
VAGQNTEIYGVVDDVTYRRDWPLLSGGPDAWEAVQQGDAAIINEQLYYRADIGLGDTLTLPDGKAKVAGIIADYGNPFAK